MKKDRLQEFIEDLSHLFPEQVELDVPLAPLTTYQVGGPAKALVYPKSREVLQQVLKRCHQENIPIFILGGGSNILVHDDGLDAVVISLQKCCAELFRRDQQVYAGAGVMVSELVEYCEANDLAGLEFMSGIPGTVGGALRMNAGAFVGEIGDRVITIEALLTDGEFVEIPGLQAGFGYRRADHLTDKILLGCWLRLFPGTRSELESARLDYLKRRSAKQPLEYGSCGSVFKRPPGNYAGTLIEKAGCKGLSVGGAMVSPKHANFIINYNHATARDIYQLIQKVQREVYKKFGTWLELEVKLIGFSDDEKEKVAQPRE